MDRLDRLKLRLKELPERPGVYLHKNAEGEVIYVGKARNLRSRVQSYLVGRGPRDARITTLIHEIDAIDCVTTNNELEAILLENNLIKSHQPRYNILLRDDKTFPYIKVTTTEDFPRVVFTRRVDRKKGDLYYGPFFAGTARRLLKLVAYQFKLRSCDLDIRDGKNALPRPCLYYDMHQCLGPCVVGLTTRDAYREMVDDVVLFLGGKSKELQDRLTQRMYRAAEGENYEIASYYRALIRPVERVQAAQPAASSAASSSGKRSPTISRVTSSPRSCSAITRTTCSFRGRFCCRSTSRTRSCSPSGCRSRPIAKSTCASRSAAKASTGWSSRTATRGWTRRWTLR